MNSTIRISLLTAFALSTASLATAQDQFFPGEPQALYIFNPLAGAQPATAPAAPATPQPASGVWVIQALPVVQFSQTPPLQTPNPANPWIGPPVGAFPGQYPPGTLIDLRTGLPLQIATAQPGVPSQHLQQVPGTGQLQQAGQAQHPGQTQPSAQPAAQHTAQTQQPIPQPPVFPYQMTVPARRFWHDIGGYGRSYFGQSGPGYSTYGQQHVNQNQFGMSRHNMSHAGQSFPQPSRHNMNRFNQSLPNTTLHNVVVPYGRNWR